MAKPRRTTKQSKQTGGTFLGIVLGLIVGLAIAVIVALYITRAPTPFVSKVAPPADSDAGASQAQLRSESSAAGQDAGSAGAASRATGAAEHRAGQTNPQTQSGMLEEPQIVEVPPSSGKQRHGGRAEARAGLRHELAPRRSRKPPGTARAAASAPKSTVHRGANAKPGSSQRRRHRRREHRLLPAGGRVQDQADAEQQRARLALPGLRIEGHAARCGRRHVLSRAHRPVLEVRGHEIEPSASVGRGRGYRCDPLFQTISQQRINGDMPEYTAAELSARGVCHRQHG